MEKPCLNNKDEYPDDEVLGRYLGDSKNIWDAFIDFIQENYPSFKVEWRYYNDGKNWLCKITKKTKTICWISVYVNLFKTTFYFAERVQDVIINSKLKMKYKNQFIDGKKYGKIKGITVDIKNMSDLETTKILIELKEKIK